jgi:two-component system chemotaxis response regulator CheY
VQAVTVNKDMNVLVVDDYPMITRLLRNLLKQLGFNNVDEASDGQAALDKIRDKTYGLIISDWGMEPLSGLDLLKGLRSTGNTVPFIMVTAESTAEKVQLARDAGVSHYIVKPFNAATLKAKMTGILGEF